MKRHLQPPGAFSGLLMRPKCICRRGRGSTPNFSEEWCLYSAPSDTLADVEGGGRLAAPSPWATRSPAVGLLPRISEVQPYETNSWLRRCLKTVNSCCSSLLRPVQSAPYWSVITPLS